MNESDLSMYSFGARIGYQIVIWPIVVIGTFGNLSVLWRVSFGIGINSPLKPMYRGVLLSLALSDLLLLATSGYNTLSGFIHPNILWTLPDWACSVLPCLQTTAALSSSLALAAIAADRYRAIKPTYPPPAGPTWPIVALLIFFIWGISIGATYPVLKLYATGTLIVLTDVSYYRASLCLTTDRSKAAVTYVAMYVAIFLPLAIAFLSVHLLLALKIWRRRRRGDKLNLATSSESQFTETSTATTSATMTSPVTLRRPMSSPPFAHRNKRTVRVVLALILVFIVCRLPMWTFAVIKLYITLSGRIWWHVQAVVTTLSLFNTAANPFMYAFINEALSTVAWVRSCCTKADDANVTTVNREKMKSNMNSIKVPRGPYSP
ncbi:galanin-like G-protein coupled receptor npr-9 [Neodiprion virginianus]|uniref:galanin-like G-protein coupled receptor npr-9 n=1 Tax=Neodiprion virginianus TaxID=2961670 RepID=UPI001EE6E9CF|nr:galanin-like G-protein coupled receptor npr-9 [Neodiprion virginianus]